ncbi:family 78 glycoside hydrolase catalytic domain (plasmid) [Arthrobacter sp. G.S.26]|uniref:alpha-L-rhamnosidase n=1 Tax=Arthrobacter sp. G.S.26 TaxID=3433706 RepID=UPI003D76AD08
MPPIVTAAPGQPKVNHRAVALGVPSASPRISWAATAQAIGYEVESTSAEGNVWTSKVANEAYLGTDWIGPALQSRARRILRVRAILESGYSAWSKPAEVEAALLEVEDWTASFIEAPITQAGRPVFRRRFQIPGDMDSARLYISFHGIGVTRINGHRIGDDVLAPGWQHYPTRLAVNVYDVTQHLSQGNNLIEIELGDGWWAGYLGFNGLQNIYGDKLGVIAQLETRKGTQLETVLSTDAQWAWTHGPTLAADLYNGETFDARQILPHDSDISDAGRWFPVTVVSDEQTQRPLRSIDAPAVRKVEELSPHQIFQSPSGRLLVDFGQNLVGWLRLTAEGPAGTEIQIRHAEVLEHGELGVRPLRAAEATDRWLLAGDGRETWEPSFTYHGFRYAEISGLPSESLQPEDVQAIVVSSDLERAGWFDCDHADLKRLHENVVWSIRGNFVSIPTDCPQRDERLGWTGDIAVFAPTASYLFDSTAFLNSWYEDLVSEQQDDGLIPYFVPSLPFPQELADNPVFKHTHTAVWGDAATLVPFALYNATGDVNILRRAFPTMKRWIDGVAALAGPSKVWDQGFQYGDWLDPTAPAEEPAHGATDPSLVATAYFAHSARLAARAAELLGFEAEHERLQALHNDVVGAFRQRFVTGAGLLTSDSQTAYAIVIQLDLLDAETAREAAAARLVELVREGGHKIGTGFVGTPLILDALTSAGALEDAYKLLMQTELPSWLYAVELGATTIWERWDSMLPDGSINPGGMTSFNHYTFGAVASWLHSTVGGLSSLAPGWTRIRVAPRPHAAISQASTAHITPAGRAAVAWNIEAGVMTLKVTVPPGTRADVDLEGFPLQELPPGDHVIRRPWPATDTEDVAGCSSEEASLSPSASR